MSLELIRPHDSFFKKLMGNVDNVRDFLKGFLPDDISSLIDYNSLKIIGTEKLNRKYKKYYLDLSIEGKIANKNCQIYIIFEHKSYPDKLTLIQILNYCCVIWEQNIKEKKELIPVIPIVFYHGRKKFDLPTRFISYFEKVDDVLKRYLVDFNIELFDTNRYRDDELINLSENLYLKSGLLAMKHIFDEMESIKPFFKQILSFGKQGFIMVLEYFILAKDIDEKELEGILKEGGITMPSLAKKWFEHGKREGILLGKQEGIQKGLIQNARDMVLEAYKIKFGKEDISFKNKVDKISDREILKRLLKDILLATSEKDLTA